MAPNIKRSSSSRDSRLSHVKSRLSIAEDKEENEGLSRDARVSRWTRLFNGRYSAIGGSDREIAFPADEACGTNNTLLPISSVPTTIDEGKCVRPRRNTRKISHRYNDKPLPSNVQQTHIWVFELIFTKTYARRLWCIWQLPFLLRHA